MPWINLVIYPTNNFRCLMTALMKLLSQLYSYGSILLIKTLTYLCFIQKLRPYEKENQHNEIKVEH